MICCTGESACPSYRGVEGVTLAFPLRRGVILGIIIRNDLLLRAKTILGSHGILLGTNAAGTNRGCGIHILHIIIHVRVKSDAAIFVHQRLRLDAVGVHGICCIGGSSSCVASRRGLLAACLAVVNEGRLVVVETEKHGAALFLWQHEVQCRDAAPQRQGKAFTVTVSYEHLDRMNRRCTVREKGLT